jgi:hypothetical protein
MCCECRFRLESNIDKLIRLTIIFALKVNDTNRYNMTAPAPKITDYSRNIHNYSRVYVRGMSVDLFY